ncbi:hypothetical protein EBS80_05145, partial [bacterium]|nr:hypothetical protein [bacterium]
MKLSLRLFLGIAFVTATAILVAAHPAFAATRTWDGGGATNNWSECANWDGPDICPGTADVATFSATSTKNATIDAGFTTGVTTFNINAGYTGIITQARSFTVSGVTTFA